MRLSVPKHEFVSKCQTWHHGCWPTLRMRPCPNVRCGTTVRVDVAPRLGLGLLARTRLPDACAVLFDGNRDALDGFTEEEAAHLTALLTRLIANLDRATRLDGAQESVER